MRSWRNGELQAIKIRSGQPSDASHETQDRMPMRCENGGPIADEFGAMFLLKRFPFEWMQDGSHGLSFVIAGLDPAIHALCEIALQVLRRRWTRGSSPTRFTHFVEPIHA